MKLDYIFMNDVVVGATRDVFTLLPHLVNCVISRKCFALDQQQKRVPKSLYQHFIALVRVVVVRHRCVCGS